MKSRSHRAESPGKLPEAGAPTIGEVRLPPGHLISPDPAFSSKSPAPALPPVAWMSDKRLRDVAGHWHALAVTFHQHGLWPLILQSLDGADDRPWDSGELDPAASTSPEDLSAEAILSNWWVEAVPLEENDEEAFEPLAPFERNFPGLASDSGSLPEADALETVTSGLPGRLGLVAVTRPADVLAVLGWQGPVNYFSDMGKLSTVLRSWEDRFGAYLVGAGFDTLELGVERPPDNIKLARAIAAEHFAACPDSIYQGAGTIEAYAERLISETSWTFWWD
jgi:hypothetical protein